MRKTIISFFILILSISSLLGQTIQKDWDKLVDYVNSRFVMDYIEHERNNSKEKENIKNYDVNIKPRIDSSNITNPLSFEELSELLKNNGWESTQSNLVAIINRKKNENNNQSIDEKINSLLSTEELSIKFQEILRDQVSNLSETLKDKYYSSQNEFENASNTIPIGTKVRENKQFLKSQNALLWIIIALIFLFQFLLMTIILSLRAKVKRERNINTIIESKRINDKFQNHKIPQSMPDFESRIRILENEIKEIKHQIVATKFELENLKSENAITQQAEAINKEESEKLQTIENEEIKKVRYLKIKSGNSFNQITNDIDDSINYRVLDFEDDNKAKFEFCGNVQNALKNTSAIFDNVCEYEGDPKNAKSIKNIWHGIVEKQEGKWVVTQKARIIFE